MATPPGKAQCVSWFIETKSDTQTQRNYRTKYGRDPPSRPSIRARHKKQGQCWIKGGVDDREQRGGPIPQPHHHQRSLLWTSFYGVMLKNQ